MENLNSKEQKILEKRLAYEKMLAELSEAAVQVVDMDVFLKHSLERMGSVLGVSRVFMFVPDKQLDVYFCRCGWDDPSLGIQRNVNGIKLKIPSVVKQMMHGEIINYPDINLMPFIPYKEHLLSEGVKSTLNVPLVVHGSMQGFIGFDEHRYKREWHDSDLYILTTAAQIISRTIENKLYEQEILEHKNLLESIFSSVQDGIITVDKTFKLIAANLSSQKICKIRNLPGTDLKERNSVCTKACLPLLKDTIINQNFVEDAHITCISNANNTSQEARISSSPLFNGAGDFIGAVMVIRDISREAYLEHVLQERSNWQGIIGQSSVMQRIYELLQTLANLDTTVLVTGESGTGKERVCHALHYGGRRAAGPYVRVNCSALAESLLESELFGHAKGAFTGAYKESIGRFEAANGGTILLDEIGDISPRIQIKLLRVLESKEIERVGETKPRKVNVRVIAATNRDLIDGIRKGSFRKDLWYRLNVMHIHLPPLRERTEDIPILAAHFISQFNSLYRKTITSLSPDVLQMFLYHDWPGNVRELEHVIERAFVLCNSGQIMKKHILFPDNPKSGNPIQVKDKNYQILDALNAKDWNISKTARMLGISRWTLYRIIKREGLVKPSQ